MSRENQTPAQWRQELDAEKARRAKYANDPAYRAKCLMESRARTARIQDDPLLHEQAKQRQREYRQRPEVRERLRAYRQRPEVRARRKANRAEENRRQKERRASGRGRQSRVYRREYHLRQLYNLTPAQYEELFEAQGLKCAMPGCGSTTPRHKNGWQVDHDHHTGKVRGILCGTCNNRLVRNGDNSAGVASACTNQLTYLAASGDIPTPAEAQRMIDFLRPYTKATPVSIVESFQAYQQGRP